MSRCPGLTQSVAYFILRRGTDVERGHHYPWGSSSIDLHAVCDLRIQRIRVLILDALLLLFASDEAFFRRGFLNNHEEERDAEILGHHDSCEKASTQIWQDIRAWSFF